MSKQVVDFGKSLGQQTQNVRRLLQEASRDKRDPVATDDAIRGEMDTLRAMLDGHRTADPLIGELVDTMADLVGHHLGVVDRLKPKGEDPPDDAVPPTPDSATVPDVPGGPNYVD